jgi:hypothetical protein
MYVMIITYKCERGDEEMRREEERGGGNIIHILYDLERKRENTNCIIITHYLQLITCQTL